MMKFIRNFGGGVILLILELWSTKVIGKLDLLSFFGIWSIILLFVLIENFFSLNSNKNVIGVQGYSNSQAPGYSSLSGALAEHEFETPEGKKKLGGFRDKTNLIYLTFFLLNAIGFVVVQVLSL